MGRDEKRKAEKGYGIGMSIFVIAFGIFWCIAVASMGAVFMLPFGLIFVGTATYRLVMMLKISKEEERPREPWEKHRSSTADAPHGCNTGTGRYCPYCGGKIEGSFAFCPGCGRRLEN